MAGAKGSWSPAWGRIADDLAERHVRGYLDGVISGALAIQEITGSLGRTLQHSLLRDDLGPKTYLEAWDLDWAAADPTGYLATRTHMWPGCSADTTISEEELDPRRSG